MLDDAEVQQVFSKNEGPDGLAAVLAEYERVTGYRETNVNAIYHHVLSQYGPPCQFCGKPLRTPQAIFCGSCMKPVAGKERKHKEQARLESRVAPAAAPKAAKSSSDLRHLGWLFGLIAVFLMGYAGFQAADENGVIPHTRETTISAKYTWLVGESKTCLSYPSDAQNADSTEQFDVTRRMICDAGEEHQIQVKFWGRTDRPEKRARNGVEWKCVKRTDSFVCYALN